MKSSEIVSITFINDYDTKTFPIVRIRLSADISVMEMIAEYPNDIYIELNLFGNMYKMNSENKTPECVDYASNMRCMLKGYIENKNTPTSTIDQYLNGIKKDTGLNVNVKVPIELYGYDADMVYYLKRQCQSIYKNMTIESVVKDILSRGSINQYTMDPFQQQNLFNQILMPNLNIMQGLSFLNSYYGMHEFGTQVYYDTDNTLYITDTSTRQIHDLRNTKALYILGYQNTADVGGYFNMTNTGYAMITKAANVSIVSETDLERHTRSKELTDVNVSDSTINESSLDLLYNDDVGDLGNSPVPTIMHKTNSPFISSTMSARIQEKTTRVDISGTGFDMCGMKINSRYNLIFESPIRGIDMNVLYRPIYVNHILSSVGNELFAATTTMSLCRN